MGKATLPSLVSWVPISSGRLVGTGWTVYKPEQGLNHFCSTVKCTNHRATEPWAGKVFEKLISCFDDRVWIYFHFTWFWYQICIYHNFDAYLSVVSKSTLKWTMGQMKSSVLCGANVSSTLTESILISCVPLTKLSRNPSRVDQKPV